MNTMEAKGHLKKRTQGRAFVYRAAEPKSRALRRVVGDFIDRVFHGSAEPLLVHLVEEKRLSSKDLEEAARMIRNKSKE